MNQNKIFQFFIIILVPILLLSACSGKTINEDGEPNFKEEISQGQLSDENLVDSDNDLSNDLSNQLLSNDKSEGSSVSSNPEANKSDSLGDDANENDEWQSSIDQSNPSVDGSNQTTDSKLNTDLTYQEYIAMTPTEQKAHYDSFNDVMDFISWLNAAKEKYNAENDSVEINSGSVDLGEIINKNS